MWDEMVLVKRGLRSDALWTRPFAFNSVMKYAPLFLDTWALMRSQFWSRDRIERLQKQRLKTLFRAAQQVPYWRDLLSQAGLDSVGDPFNELRRLPVTSKRELMATRPEGILDTSLIPYSDADHTSGSTGTPFHFRQDWQASLRSFGVTERIFRTATGTRYPIVYMRGRQRNGFTPYKHVWFFARSFNGIEHRMKDMKELGERLAGGFVLYGYTSWILEVARQMERLDITLPLKAVMVAGEHLTKKDEEYIKKVMGTEPFSFYASRETGFLGYECPLHTLHLSEEWAYFEVVDEEGKPLPAGKEGRILVTTFDNRIMPFIRYDLGDRGIIHDEPCPCGRTLRTITFRGRTAELIELEGGRVVSLLDIAANIDWYWQVVRTFQLVQKSKSVFSIRVVPGPSYEEGREVVDELLKRLLHPDIELTWELVESIPEAKSGKAVYFVRE